MSFIFSPPNNNGAELVSASLATDASTSSSSYADLHSASLTVGGPTAKVDIEAPVTLSVSLAAITSLQLLVDGSIVDHAIDLTLALGAAGTAFLSAYGVSLATGTHTVKIQWRTTVGSARCRPATANERAAIRVLQVG